MFCGQTNHIASLCLITHREIRIVRDQQWAVWTPKKLAGGRLNIKTQQRAMWGPRRGDMRVCRAEKRPGLRRWWDLCLVMGCLGEIPAEMFGLDTELQSRCVFKRSVFVVGCVQIFKKCIPLCQHLLVYETFVRTLYDTQSAVTFRLSVPIIV